jgi:surface protein
MNDEWIKKSESRGKICWVNIITGERKCSFITYEDGTSLPRGWERWHDDDIKSFYYSYTDERGKTSESSWAEPPRTKYPQTNIFSPSLATRLQDIPSDVMIIIIEKLFKLYPLEASSSAAFLMSAFSKVGDASMVRKVFAAEGTKHVFNLVDTETWVRMIVSMGFNVNTCEFRAISTDVWKKEEIDYQKKFVEDCRYTNRAHDLLDLKHHKDPFMSKVVIALLNKLISADSSSEAKEFLEGTRTGKKFKTEREFVETINQLNKNANTDMKFWDVREINKIEGIDGLLEGLRGSVDLRYWDTSKMTSMEQMFYGSNALITGLENWNTSRVKNMMGMFGNTRLFNCDISRWDTRNCTNMRQMFLRARTFNQYLEWDTRNVQNMSSMFEGALSFNNGSQPGNIPPRPSRATAIGSQPQTQQSRFRELKWNTSQVTDMNNMFRDTGSFNQPLPWNTSKCINMSHMFESKPMSPSVFNQPLNHWDTSNVTDMSHMFDNNPTFNQDLNMWKTSSCLNMSHMFESATAFNGIISNWDTSNVQNMSHMFMNAHLFNKPLHWNTSRVQDMSSMFSGASEFNGDISEWKTENVENMNSMFFNAESFNSDIRGWNTRSVMDISYMFSGTRSFTRTLPWDVTRFSEMTRRLAFSAGSQGSFGQIQPPPQLP